MSEWLDRHFGLDGKVALVTGARTGIGRASALSLAHAGADVVLWGRRSEDLEDVAKEVDALGRQVRTVAADVAELDQVRDAADRVLSETRVDILVNNAGIIERGPAADTPFDSWRRVLSINLDAVFALCQVFGRPMLERGSGSVVNIASLLSFQGGIGVPAYTASKHAIAGLTKSLANEWAPHGVNVNAVAPGYVVTNNTEALRRHPERERSIRERIPAGRWADPQDIAGAVAFLSSPAASYVHGHVLVVDGGWMGR
jgi:2-dehydro-3-deoxy-D-gluconate 5-dehydrogenase